MNGQDFDDIKIRSAIAKAVGSAGDLSVNDADAVAFHMVDWLSEFQSLLKVFLTPESISSEELNRVLMQFLLHAPAHIVAAAKLYTGEPVADVFEVGATKSLDHAIRDAPGAGHEPVLDARQEAAIVAMLHSKAPDGHARWSISLIVKEAVRRKIVLEVSDSTIERLLKRLELKP
jgi:hypothetical protein